MFWKMTTISRQNRKYVEAADAGTEIEVVEQPAWHAISHASLSAESVDLADPDLPVSAAKLKSSHLSFFSHSMNTV